MFQRPSWLTNHSKTSTSHYIACIRATPRCSFQNSSRLIMLNRLRAFLLASLALVSSAALAQRNRLIPAEPMVAKNSSLLSEWVGGFVYLSDGRVLPTEIMRRHFSESKESEKRFKEAVGARYVFTETDTYCLDIQRRIGVYRIGELPTSDDDCCGDYYPQTRSSKHTFLAKVELGGSPASEMGHVSKPFSGDGSL